MPALIVITGAMRTGGSAVAELVHRLGFPAATSIMAPIPPHWWSDWEDREATAQMARWGMPWQEPDADVFAAWFDGYIGCRYAAARSVCERAGRPYRGLAVKSCMYAPFVSEIRRAASDGDHVPVVIETARRPQARRASIERLGKITGVAWDRLDMASDRLGELASGAGPDFLVPYEALLADPIRMAEGIANATGQVIPHAEVEEAAACITQRRY